MTATDEAQAAFNAALAQDAGRPAQDDLGFDADPPPVKEAKPADDKPRTRKRAEPKGDAKPRTAPAALAPDSGKDYAPGLLATGEQIWVALSVNHGVSLGKRKMRDGSIRPLLSLPDTRPYATVFHRFLPLMARAWSEGANQNPTVRRWVSKFAGDAGEGISWVLMVGLSSAMFAMGCAKLAEAQNVELRAQLAEQNDAHLAQYLQTMLEKMGMPAE